MAKTVRSAGLETRTARLRREPRGKPYYIDSGRQGVQVGYRRRANGNGSWVVKTNAGRMATGGRAKTETIGEADDFVESDGSSVLTYFEAMKQAGAVRSADQRKARYTVENAIEDHVNWLKVHRAGSREDEIKLRAYAAPYFGDRLLCDLKGQDFDAWLSWAINHTPNGRRSGKVTRPKINLKKTADSKPVPRIVDAAERKRRKRSTLNRVINSIKACLNRAFMNGNVDSDLAWRRLKKFKGADSARVYWLTVAQCERLINAAAPDFRSIVHAALLTGARWGELRALKNGDFDAKSGTVNIAQSKSGKPRRVYLTDDGKQAFESWTAGRPGSSLIFTDRSGNGWGDHAQHRPMKAACIAAKIEPAVGFHVLRHSYASSLVQVGVSLAVVGAALGHADTRMVSQHYGHLSPSHVADAIRAHLPVLNVSVDKTITAIRR